MRTGHDTIDSLTALVQERGSRLAQLPGVESVGVVPDAQRPAILVCLAGRNPLVMLKAKRALRGHRVIFRVTGAAVTAEQGY